MIDISDRDVIEIPLTANERERLEALAHRRGYPALVDYVRALLEAEANEDDDDSEEASIEGFRTGWHEAMTGQTFPAETLWDDMDGDEASSNTINRCTAPKGAN